jgi:hypothetical protein
MKRPAQTPGSRVLVLSALLAFLALCALAPAPRGREVGPGEPEGSQPRASEEGPNGVPLPVNLSAESLSEPYSGPLPVNLSCPVEAGWAITGARVSLAGVSRRGNRGEGGSLDTQSERDSWDFETDDGENFNVSEGEEYCLLLGNGSVIQWTGEAAPGSWGALAQNVSLPDPLAPGKTVKLLATFGSRWFPEDMTHASVYVRLEVSNASFEELIHPIPPGSTAVNLTVGRADLPTEVPWLKIYAGVKINESIPDEILVDEIALIASTRVKENNTLFGRWGEDGRTYNYTSLGEGTGEIYLGNGESGSERLVDCEVWGGWPDHLVEVEEAVLSASVLEETQSTHLGVPGSRFDASGAPVQWEADISAAFPSPASSRGWEMRIGKPGAWTVTGLEDPFGLEVSGESSVTGCEENSTAVTVGPAAAAEGAWRLGAESPNVIEGMSAPPEAFPRGNLSVNASFGVSVTGNATCDLFHPNGSVRDTLYAGIEGGSASFDFGALSNSDPMGEYLIEVRWDDGGGGQASAAGLASTPMHLRHRASLDGKAVEAVVGEGAIATVNATDLDLGEAIEGLLIKYNGSWGAQGLMAGLGGGVYALDLNGSDLGEGDHHLDLGADSDLYERLNLRVNITVSKERLEMTGPSGIVGAVADYNATFEVGVSGEKTGRPVVNGSVRADAPWGGSARSSPLGDGSYRVEIDTSEALSGGVSKTFQIDLTASADGYAAAEPLSVSVRVSPGNATISTNETSLTISGGGVGEVEIRYLTGEGDAIASSACATEWPGEAPEVRGGNGTFRVEVSASGLSAGGHLLAVECSASGTTTCYLTLPVSVTSEGSELTVVSEEEPTFVRGDPGSVRFAHRYTNGSAVAGGSVRAESTVNGTVSGGEGEFTYTFATGGLDPKAYLLSLSGTPPGGPESPARRVLLRVVPLELLLETPDGTVVLGGGGNVTLVTVVDESHGGLPSAAFSVTCRSEGESWRAESLGNGSFGVDLGRLGLTRERPLGEVEVRVDNPYGDSPVASIRASLLERQKGESPLHLAAFLVLLSGLSALALGIAAKRRWGDSTPLQRAVRRAMKGRGQGGPGRGDQMAAIIAAELGGVRKG